MKRSTPALDSFTRRRILTHAVGALALAGLGPTRSHAGPPLDRGRLRELRPDVQPFRLIAKERPLTLTGGRAKIRDAWLYGDDFAPVWRIKQHETVTASLANALPRGQHTTVHWHGIRLVNAMDGVPFLTQPPVNPGEIFSYTFAAPDAGTFFFHPHCNTVEQLGRGLFGILVVEGDETAPLDDDIVCVLKDWRIDGDGAFLPFMTEEGATRAGTFGTVRTVNGSTRLALDVPAAADIRLRLVNVDVTRLCEIGIDGAEAAVIAIDGNPVAPFPLKSWKLGPAMRVDLAVRTGPSGSTFRLVDYYAEEPVTLARVRAQGERRRKTDFAPVALRAAGFATPDPARARMIEMPLGVGLAPAAPVPDIKLPGGRTIPVMDSLCQRAKTFWTLGGRSWPPQGHAALPPPLFTTKRGETLRLVLANRTAFPHPVHLHGHSFRVLSASKLARPVHDADTVLVAPNERVEIAFVADNPGDWMIHCHIIEHQETGMMGWFRVV